MKYKKFRDITLSCLGMGNMRLPEKDGVKGSIDWDESQKIIDYAMSHGINYYDTAYTYNKGESERCLGHCISKYPRNTYYLATKYYIGSNPEGHEAAFEEQLQRLQTDHIDFFLVHCLMDKNIDQYLESGCIDYYLEQQKKGRIRYLGFSSHASPETLARFADHHKWDFAQLQLNWLDWDANTAREEYRVLDEREIPIMVMEPVRGGKLAALSEECDGRLKEACPDWSIASWALRFVETLPRVQVILSGMSNLEQMADNVATFSDQKSLNEEQLEVLKQVSARFREQIHIPCTGCRYCTEDCPAQINIPEYLKFLNAYKLEGIDGLDGVNKVESSGKPKDCLRCGMCMSHCPQNIEIPARLAELVEAMKG